MCAISYFSFFFFNDTATTEIYTLSLHDALPICLLLACRSLRLTSQAAPTTISASPYRSEEHTSELQSHLNLVCRLLLEKKKTNCTYLIRRMRLVRYRPALFWSLTCA